MVRAGAQQAERQTDMVVEIALRGERGPLRGEDLGRQLFGRGFSVAARHADDGRRESPGVPAGKVLECGQRIVHRDAGCTRGWRERLSPVEEKPRCTARYRVRNVAMAIGPGAGQRYEQGVRFDVPRIDAHRTKRDVRLSPTQGSTRGCTYIPGRKRHSHH